MIRSVFGTFKFSDLCLHKELSHFIYVITARIFLSFENVVWDLPGILKKGWWDSVKKVWWSFKWRVLFYFLSCPDFYIHYLNVKWPACSGSRPPDSWSESKIMQRCCIEWKKSVRESWDKIKSRFFFQFPIVDYHVLLLRPPCAPQSRPCSMSCFNFRGWLKLDRFFWFFVCPKKACRKT